MQQKHTIFSVCFLAAIMAFPLSSFAQTDNQTQNRLRQLEKQIQTMSRAVYRGEQIPVDQQGQIQANPSAAPMANLEIRLSEIEDQLRSVTGQLEQLEYENHRLKQRIDTLESRSQNGGIPTYNAQPSYTQPNTPTLTAPDQPVNGQTATLRPPVQYQNNTQQNTLNTLPQGTQSLGTLTIPQDTVTGAPAVPHHQMTATADTPEKAYENAYAKIREAKYEEAATAFTQFIQVYPDNKLSANAQYWLAETYYVRGQFADAAKLFAKGYQAYPKSGKTPDNLLKLGLSLAQLGKKKDACLTFQQLQKEFSDKKGLILQRSIDEQKRLGCNT